jgi:hypothetical protein
MTQRTPPPKAAPTVLDPEAEKDFRGGVGAAAMLLHKKVQALLNPPDAEPGRLLKYGIAQLANLSTSVTFEGCWLSQQRRKPRAAGKL